MSTRSLNLTCTPGDTLELSIVYRAGAPPLPVNLTGYSADFAIVDRKYARTAVRLTAGANLTLGSDGTIAVTVPASMTAGLKNVRSARHQLRLTDTAGKKFTILRGAVTILPAPLEDT